MTTKIAVLTHLKNNMNQWISGQELSGQLSVSRMAVSKQIANLKSEGYDIVSAPKKGYRLKKLPDLISAQELAGIIDTRTFGRKEVIYLGETESTNSVAKDAAAGGAPEGTLVIAETQTKGRGRKNRTWHSPETGGVFFSMVLRPTLPPQETPVLTLMTAVALAEAIENRAQITPVIKWPNDLLVKGKKIAGILTEMSAMPDSVEYVIVGVGINVNTTADLFADEIKPIATSLFMESGNTCSRVRLIAEFLSCFEKYHSLFKGRQFGAIIERWKFCSNIIGQEIKVDVLGKLHEGQVVDIENTGALILQDKQGKNHRLLSGDVIYSEKFRRGFG